MPFGAGRHYNSGRNAQTARYPLRKVISEDNEDGLVYNLLECGHRILAPSDFVSQTHADRRRCRHCWRETQDSAPAPPNTHP